MKRGSEVGDSGRSTAAHRFWYESRSQSSFPRGGTGSAVGMVVGVLGSRAVLCVSMLRCVRVAPQWGNNVVMLTSQCGGSTGNVILGASQCAVVPFRAQRSRIRPEELRAACGSWAWEPEGRWFDPGSLLIHAHIHPFMHTHSHTDGGVNDSGRRRCVNVCA